MENSGHEINSQRLEYDRMLRFQITLGCQQAKQLELKLNDAPHGYLELADSHQATQILHASLINDAAAVVGTFSKVLSYLTSGESLIRKSRETAIAEPTSSTPKQASGTPPISPSSGLNLPPSPPLENPSNNLQQNRIGPSAIASCWTSVEGQPSLGGVVSPEVETGGSSHQHQDIPKRRKISLATSSFTLPLSIKKRGVNVEALNPDDGFLWRKYGQKGIHNSSHPRSYYKCRYRRELGCLATKRVQRSDENPSFLRVTYNGVHTCHPNPMHEQQQHPPSLAMPAPPHSPPSAPQSSLNLSSRMLHDLPEYQTIRTTPFSAPYFISPAESLPNYSWQESSHVAATAHVAPSLVADRPHVTQSVDGSDYTAASEGHAYFGIAHAVMMMQPSAHHGSFHVGDDDYQLAQITRWNGQTSDHTSAEFAAASYLQTSSLDKDLATHQILTSLSPGALHLKSHTSSGEWPQPISLSDQGDLTTVLLEAAKLLSIPSAEMAGLENARNDLHSLSSSDTPGTTSW